MNMASVFLVALTILAKGTSAWSQASIEVSSSVEDAVQPARILAMQPGTQTYLDEVTDGWGTLDVPPGRYEVMVVPGGDRALPVRFGPVEATAGLPVQVDVGSGLRLTSDEGLPPLDWWIVTDVADGEVVAQVAGRWGFTPLPPGRYRVEVPLPGVSVRSRPIEVDTGGVSELALAGLGLGRVVLGMPDRRTEFLFGEMEMTPLLVLGDERYDIGGDREDDEIALWFEAGPIALERRAGALIDRNEVEVIAGQELRLPFDLEIMSEERELSVFELARDAERMSVVAARGDRALLTTSDPKLGTRYVAPGGAIVRLSGPGDRSQVVVLPIGESERLVEPDGGAQSAEVMSLALERPRDGAEMAVGSEMVQVVGQASETSEAGLTKIALVIDTSGSTADPSGSDLDGDGSAESILDAEKAAALALIKALAKVEKAAPGTTFAVSVVAFGDTAHSVLPMLPLTEPRAAARLQRAVSGLAHGVEGGSTFYDRAIDAAARLLSSMDRAGPEIILLVTDGKPSQIVPAIDAAARVGLDGVVLHTIGLGADFGGAIPDDISYPPISEDGPVILTQMAAFSAAGGRAWALPKPADVVDLVPSLPVLERRDADIRNVRVRNETLGREADPVALRPDGTFSARVPVAFGSADAGWSNLLSVSAVGASGATARQEIRVLADGRDPGLLERAEADREALARQVEDVSARARAAEREAARMGQDIKALEASLAAAGGRAEELTICTRARVQCEAERADALQQLFKPVPAADGIVVTVPGDVLFDFDATELRPDAGKAVDLAAAFLRDYERSDLVIEGHTDSLGSERYNSRLSRARAEAVAAWLVEESGIAADRITARGMGESRPVAEEVTPDGRDAPDGRQRNRRVEIRILR